MKDSQLNLVNVDSELAKKIYDDVFSPSLKKAWNALSDIIGLVTSITVPIAMMNNYTNFILRKNLKKYEKKLEDIDIADRVSVNPEIWVPILEKLTYYNNDTLSNLFLELLTKASNRKAISSVHPKYIKIIENLSEDEAIILKFIFDKKSSSLPAINVHLSEKWKKGYSVIMRNFSEIHLIESINFRDRVDLYLNNLHSLWIISIWWIESFTDKKVYDPLKNSEEIKRIKQYYNNPASEYIFKEAETIIVITSFGLWFLKAVFPTLE